MNCFVNVCEKHRIYAVWYRSFKNAENNFSLLRIHWRLSTILKASNKSVWSNVLLYKFWKNSLLFNTLYIWKKHKNSFGQDKRYKKCTFFRELQLITVLLLICNSCKSWKPKVHLSKSVCVWFCIFDSVFFLLKFKLFDFKSS